MQNSKQLYFKIFFFIYLFLNSIGLPFGLLYTTVFSPIFFINLIRKKKKSFFTFLFLILIYVIVHSIDGIENYQYYFKSLLLFMGVITVAFILYYKLPEILDLDILTKKMIVCNFIFTLFAILMIQTSFNTFFWTNYDTISANINMKRLYLGAYEPSYYSTLIAPLTVFSLLNFHFNHTKSNFVYLILALIPLFLSFSFTIISLILFSFLLIFLIDSIKTKKYHRIVFLSIFTLGFLLIFSQNYFILRLSNVLSGSDSSGNTRTLDALSYTLAILEKINIFWGAGFGQIKLLGSQIFGSSFSEESFRIPNTTAEILITLGIAGIAIKFFLEFFLFIKFKIYNNPFNLSMFIIAFGLQLVGSFITNTAEYVIWALAFSPIFQEFNFAKRT